MADIEYLSASITDLTVAILVSIGLLAALITANRRNQIWVSGLVVLGAVAVSTYTLNELRERYVGNLQLLAEDRLSEIGQRLETTLEARLVEARAVGAHIASRPDLTQSEYNRYLDDLIAEPQLYTNLAAARDMTINLLYPVEGNEPALGLNYPEVPSQWPWIQLALSTGDPVLIGPIDLVQGGRGFIIHHGVTTDGEIWGVTAAVMPLGAILFNSGLMNLLDDFSVAIEAQLSDESGRQLIWTSNTVPDNHWASSTQTVPNGEWTFHIEPRTTPSLPTPLWIAALATMGLLTLAALVVILLLARSRGQSELAREALETTAHMLDEAQRVGGMGSWSLHPNQDHCVLSPQLSKLLGRPRSIATSDWETLIPGAQGLQLRQALDALIRGDLSSLSMQHELSTRVGTLTVEHSAELVNRPSGAGTMAVATLIDITEKKETERQLERLAYYDSLTSIPNRYYFRQELERLLVQHQQQHQQLALLHIDLDHFKDINDSLGHQIGDEVLTIVSKRLKQALKPNDLLARTGGDEFMAVLSDVKGSIDASQVARRIITKLSSPTTVQSQEVFIGVSIGIALYPDHATDYEGMYQRADLALYRAKLRGRGNFQVYAAHLAEDFDRRMALESAMRIAIEQDEFYLEYQPKIDLLNEEIVGLEALLRWRSERYGQIMPDEFIPIAETSGQILSLGRWVLATAMREFAQARSQLPDGLRLSINLSPRQIQSTDLKSDIMHALKANQLPGRLLDLEITETFIVSDYGHCESFMRELSQLGISFSLDDFGTGYSNLVSLRNLPLSTLKIDKSFVRDITRDGNHRAIVETIIQLGDNLGMTVVAEGIETEAQQAALQAMGCQVAQGYRFSRPVSMRQITEEWVSRSDV